MEYQYSCGGNIYAMDCDRSFLSAAGVSTQSVTALKLARCFANFITSENSPADLLKTMNQPGHSSF